MENQKSGQTVRFILLFLACFFLTRSFFNPPKPSGPPRTVPTLQAAFAGTFGNEKLSPVAAKAELATIDKAIGGFTPPPDPGFWAKMLGTAQPNPNASDPYSYWARLRAALLQQYILKDKDAALRGYDQILASYTSDQIYAQALYQRGDLLWHTSKVGEPRRHDAAYTLEQLVVRNRGAARFLNSEILVPQPAPSSAQNPSEAVLSPTSFRTTKVDAWRSTTGAPKTEGLADRVDFFYTPTTFHIVFDQFARLMGNSNARYSYGLAILFFAVMLRILLQPITRKQYNSMKGMAEVAPEVKKIQEKYKDKPEKQMDMLKETRELYKSKGANPQLGCLLGLVQLPIFFYVVAPFIQHYEAKLDLVGASFLWIDNLARPDWPLLIAYAISQFLSFRLSATPPADPQQAQMQGIMAFIFPVTVPFFLKDWPSAFTLYWMMFNIVSTFFQWRMMRASNPDRSVLKAIFESPMAGVRAAEAAAGTTDAGALPSRPNKSSTRSGEKSAENGFNGTRNGNNGKNGTGKSGTILQSVSAKELREVNGAPENESAVATTTQKNNAAAAAARRRRRKRR